MRIKNQNGERKQEASDTNMDIVRPMEPISNPEVFDSSDYVFQVKWDGVRMLSYIEGNEVRLINKKLNPRTVQYPELQQLPEFLAGHKAILDGEIIVLKDGKPSFPSVMKRDQCSSGKTISCLTHYVPINYMVFDILFLNKSNLTAIPWQERAALLIEAVDFSSPLLYLVENFSQGKNLFEAVKNNDMEGIVAKRKNSLYIQGKHHRDWLKIKYRRSLCCVIGGYTLRSSRVNSLLLGIYQDENLLYLGRAGSGLSEADKDLLTTRLGEMNSSVSPFSINTGVPPAIFTRPLLTVRVEYAEWTENMHLRSPVIKGFTATKPEECTL